MCKILSSVNRYGDLVYADVITPGSSLDDRPNGKPQSLSPQAARRRMGSRQTSYYSIDYTKAY